MLILNSFFIFSHLNNDQVSGSFVGEDATPPVTGDWIIDSGGNIVINETIILNGNLFVKNGGALIFKNVTLLMNCQVNGSYNIVVDNGGQFFIFDYDNNCSTTKDVSIITSNIPDYNHRFYFHVKSGAKFEMKNSELHECGYYTNEPPNAYWTEGLCIEANNSLIENCTISNNLMGVMLYYYSNHSKILNSKITHNLASGIYVSGIYLISYLNNISIKNCIIASNGKYCSGEIGISIFFTKDSKIINCGIYHHPYSGISFGECHNVDLSFNEIINNNYGLFISDKNSNVSFNNNTIMGNLEYSIFNYGNEYINTENNYFGTTNELQINHSIWGNNVDYTPWLNYRESNILHINNSQKWKNSEININNGLIINGNLTIDNSKIILNNSDGKNFLQVNGKLIIENSSILVNKSLPDIDSVWGYYSFKYSYGSSGYLKNSKFQDQKGININMKFMNITNCTFSGNISHYLLWALILRGNNSSINNCNITGFGNGIQINSNYNLVKNNNIFSNRGDGITIKGNNNTIRNCSFSNLSAGIYIEDGNENIISGSNFFNNSHGISFLQGKNNTISNCNFISNEYYGIAIRRTPVPKVKHIINNMIYHNNFIKNGVNNSDGGNSIDTWFNNFWDNGYPSGGNYWDDYLGNDFFLGENQSIIGSDNLGDKPYKIQGNSNRNSLDHFPLMNPVGIKYYISNPVMFPIPSPNPDGNFTLSWTSVPNATNYTIYEEHEGKISTTEFGLITNLEIIGKPNGTYQYYVQAKNDKVVSRKSNTTTVIVDYPPEIPKGLTAIPISEGNALELNWELNEIDTINYSLWSNHTGTWKELTNITHPSNQFIHIGLTDGVKYYYKIKAWDGINQSSKFSKIIFGIPGDIVPPMAPIDLKTSTISNSSIELTWQKNNESDLAGYDLYRTLNLELNFSKINIEPIINNSYLDTGLNGNTTYYYKLMGYDEVPNYSKFSNIAFNTTYLTSPRVILYSPTGVDVSLDSKIEIIFNKPMNKASVKKGFVINPDINGNIFWENDQRTMVFHPENELAENTTYNITLVNPILDLEGGMLPRTFSWEFRTVELPKIIDFLPQGDFVNTDTVIAISFNRDMNKTSVEEAISIDPEVNGTFKWINEKKLIFEPDKKLPELTTYKITIDYLAKDLIGNNLQDDFSWSFRTGDFTAPDIISYSPTDDGLAVDTQISIVFSEPMNKSRVETSFSISPDIDGEIQWHGNTLVFIPDNNLKYDTKYIITLSSDAIDKWGNNLVDDLSWEFTTQESENDEKKGTNYELELIVSIILFIIVLVIVFIIILMRRKRDTSDKDVLQQQDDTQEE